ncbi:hypothetical protein ACFRKE_01110 [Kitasatospora indigofera]|uniref:hypothetical protein n=1 Tax=Kitasatospora indigofera TaxID=67307 RepID=UPI0036CA3FA7
MTDDQGTAPPAGYGTGVRADLNGEVHYPPVENGLDYMVSVVEHLQGEKVGRRDLKYAVVHLQAAVECLLKYRLELEHWSLVFKNPGEAKRSELDDASLTSCTVEQTITRLTSIAGVAISEGEKTKLKQLARLRNQLQHYGRPHDPKVNRFAIEANAAQVLEFLVHFMESELRQHLSDSTDEVNHNLGQIYEGIDEIRDYVKARMRRLAPELDPVKTRTVQCPYCDQLALVVGEGDGEDVRCLYCRYQGRPDAAAWTYGEEVLGRTGWSEPVRGGPEPVEDCLLCDDLALVCGAVTAADPKTPVDLCFNCGESHSERP